jgi:pyruvate-formate lyase-activating enzyme
MSPFLLAPGGRRLIQIQPTLRCNLRCAHCYSESGPDRRGEISFQRFTGFLEEAATLGYDYVGVSGGEPLLWKGLDEFLDFARDTGFSTSVTTNATLLRPKRAARLAGRVGLVAVSVDGPPDEHNAIRGSSTAFSSMRRGVAALRDAGISFTFAFTLTRFNADRLTWLYEFADEEGALGVSVHPLCDFGAASENLPDAVPDGREFQAAAWLLALLRQRRGPGGPGVTIDVMRRVVVEQSCWPVLDEDRGLLEAPFAELVPALVVEPDGCIVPFIYGFPRTWAVGFIDRGSLPAAAEAWRVKCATSVAELVRSTLARLADERSDYIDLFGEVLRSAGRPEAVIPRPFRSPPRPTGRRPTNHRDSLPDPRPSR